MLHYTQTTVQGQKPQYDGTAGMCRLKPLPKTVAHNWALCLLASLSACVGIQTQRCRAFEDLFVTCKRRHAQDSEGCGEQDLRGLRP